MDTDRTLFARARRAVSVRIDRARERRALAALDDRALKDIGLTRSDVAAGTAQWRWRA